MGDALFEAYHKYAPRWVKVIQWRRLGKKVGGSIFVAGAFSTWYWVYLFNLQPQREAFIMYLKEPKTEEERLFIKRQHKQNLLRRNWDIDQYEYGQPPPYDMWERRQKYPEYYAGRYKADGPRYETRVDPVTRTTFA